MKTKSAATLAMGLLLVSLAAIPTQADTVIFSNLGAGDSYNGTTGWTLGTTDGGANSYSIGSAFTVGATSANLSTIEVAAGLVTGTNQLTIDLDADSGGSPGAVIESITINGGMPTFGSNSSGNLVTATSALHPLLTAGSQYWVVLIVPDDGTTWAAWNWNSTGDTGTLADYDHGVSTGTFTDLRGAMRISGLSSSVPEPSSLVLACTAAGVIIPFVSRSRRKRRSPDVAPSVED